MNVVEIENCFSLNHICTFSARFSFPTISTITRVRSIVVDTGTIVVTRVRIQIDTFVDVCNEESFVVVCDSQYQNTASVSFICTQHNKLQHNRHYYTMLVRADNAI